MNPQKESWELLAHHIIKEMGRRNMEGYYCSTSEEAVAKAMSLIPAGAVVAWGGSETLRETGMLERLKNSGQLQIIDRDTAADEEEKRELQLRSFGADYYFMSTNAITREGELINIDGAGNRVACLIYGPRAVIMLAGMNKVVKDVESGIERVRNISAPPNAKRLQLNTPCAKVGYCMDCHSEDCICSDMVITRHTRQKNRIKVILVGESLGY